MVRLTQWANGWSARLVTVEEDACRWSGGPFPTEGEALRAAQSARAQITGEPEHARVWMNLDELARLRLIARAAEAFVLAGQQCQDLEIAGNDVHGVVRFLRATRELRIAVGDPLVTSAQREEDATVAATVEAIRARCRLAASAVMQDHDRLWEALRVGGGLDARTFRAACDLRTDELAEVLLAIGRVS